MKRGKLKRKTTEREEKAQGNNQNEENGVNKRLKWKEELIITIKKINWRRDRKTGRVKMMK